MPEAMQTWDLSLGDRAALSVRSDTVPVGLRPVEPGHVPRLELSGHDLSDVTVDVQTSGDGVRVTISRPKRAVLFGFTHAFDLRAIAYVPSGLRASVEAEFGGVDVAGLGQGDLKLQTRAGPIQVEDVAGRLDLEAGAGSITVRRGSGEIEAESDAGLISMADVTGRVSAEADAGSITIRGLRGSIKAETQAGPIRLEIAGLDAGDHRVETSMGPITVTLAAGLVVDVQARTTIGPVRNSVTAQPGSAVRLQLKTDIGPIIVREGAPPS
ncbi:MAG: DUF4097 domain-containing protein [Dehalococcoidia bacterium]